MPVREPRAYDPNALRQQRRTTLVYSLDDIRRAMQLALNENRPCDLEMGANIVLNGAFVVHSALPSFSLSGAGRFKLFVDGNINTLFRLDAPSTFGGVSIVTKTGSVVTNAFSVAPAASPVVIDNVVVDATNGTLTNVFSATTSTATRLIVQALTCTRITNLFAAQSVSWFYSQFSDITVTSLVATPATIGTGSADAAFVSCTFSRISGFFNVNIAAASDSCIFEHVLGPGVTVSFNVNGSLSHLLLNVQGFPTVTPGNNSLVIGPFGRLSALLTPPSSVTLSTAGPTITVGNSSFLRVTHAAGSSGNVTLAAGVDGQRLTLFFVSYAGTAVYTTGVGNLMLAASPFTPTANDTMELIYDATTARWVEVSRSINA